MTFGFKEDDDLSYWLGGEPTYKMTLGKRLGLRVELWDDVGTFYTSEFDFFGIGESSSNYWLDIGDFVKGSAGDGKMARYSAPLVSTDNDITNSSCSVHFTTAWWYQAATFDSVDSCALSVLVPNPEVGIRWLSLPKPLIRTVVKARYINDAEGEGFISKTFYRFLN